MFGSETRLRRPVVLVLVLGVLLVLVGITAAAQAAMVSAYASASTLGAVVDSDVATIRGFVHQALDGLDVTSPDRATVDRVNGYLETLLAKGGIAHAEIRAIDGGVIAASSGQIGGLQPRTPDFLTAVAGTPAVAIVAAADAEVSGVQLPATVLREYLPLRQADTTVVVVGLWRDATPFATSLDALRGNVVLVTLTAALIAAAVLVLLFRAAQARISRQTAALVNASRLDALTETLNHGAVVGHLAQQIERARASGMPLGVALVDVDNFRLLNDTHGHRSGDEVLLLLAGVLQKQLGDEIVMGRYGPDEFLLVAGSGKIVELESIGERVRATLADTSLEFEASERLPLTVSIGICTFPDHGDSVTELLSTVAATLREAKSGGGDAIRVADAEAARRHRRVSNFDVLQGLVLAVDTKDRYTKRHSEDVATYAVFLAEQLGVAPDGIAAIRTAGLLHDVGKIAVPDAILRKPSRLTADELEVLKQHVALGATIVRDVPDIDDVRAGIRHHHERWDGRGYLDALAGGDIPLIARILAVGDAFSAMTTTRPYRKALDVSEALRRLGDAAGTQLDESLVALFIRALETVPNAPLPGVERPRAVERKPRRVA